MSEITATILRHDYLLTCPDGQEDALRQAVQIVENSITTWRESGKLRLREQAAVVVAVNLAFERIGLQAQIARLEEEVRSLRQRLDTATAPEVMQQCLRELQAQNAADRQTAARLSARVQALLDRPLPAVLDITVAEATPPGFAPPSPSTLPPALPVAPALAEVQNGAVARQDALAGLAPPTHHAASNTADTSIDSPLSSEAVTAPTPGASDVPNASSGTPATGL